MSTLRTSSRVLAWLAERTVVPIEEAGHVRARAEMRAMMRRLRQLDRPVPMAEVADERVAGVPVRRFVPHAPAAGRVVYFHGGGWVVGDLDTHDGVCRALARACGREVVSVDYRLAPEHPYPAAIEDALAVVRAVAPETRTLVAGDSAGGHLAAVVARQAAADALALAGQLLTYPVTDCAGESPSYERFATGHLLTRRTMRYFRETFVPEPARRDAPDASPLRAPPVRTAPAYVLLAGCDVLHDEGLAYAEKLRAEGTEVTVDDVPGVLHGFASIQALAPGREALARAGTWARRVLAS